MSTTGAKLRLIPKLLKSLLFSLVSLTIRSMPPSLYNCLGDENTWLDSLGFEYVKSGSSYLVTIPNRRLDVEPNRQDLVEEIGRLYGYDNIDSKLPIITDKKGEYIGNVKYRKIISKRLRALGLDEVKTYTLVSDEDILKFTHNNKSFIELLKPMSNDKKYVRQSLIPSLLKVVDYNKSRGIKDINIYEISNVYYDKDIEETKVSILIVGNYLNNNWNKVNVKSDFYVLKGIVESVFDYLGLKNRYTFKEAVIDSLHPGVSAEVLIDREYAGYIGKVHPSICKKDDIYVCELSLNLLASKNIRPIKFKEISKYPGIEKDLAFILDKNITSEEVISVIKKAGGKLLTNIEVFDLYEGDRIEPNKKSIAYSLKFEDPTRTLTEEEVMIIFNKIISDVEQKLNAKLRNN